MGTANFYNHENGIFVLPMADYEATEEFLIGEHGAEEVNDDMIYEQINIENEFLTEEFFKYQLKPLIEEYGMELSIDSMDFAEVYRKGRMVAQLRLEGGYYEGCQVIVETNPEEIFVDHADLFYNETIQDYQDEIVKSKLKEVYTPHNKTLFKAIKKCTTAYGVVGVFSNGEAVYSLA